MHVLIVANGDPPSHELAGALGEWADLVIGADGGAAKALALGLRIDRVVGDLDSLTAEVRAAVGDEAIVRAPSSDMTDLHKAVDYAFEMGATAVQVIGGSGGRWDHAIANLSVLVAFRGGDVRLADDAFEVRLVDGVTAIEAPVGTVVSLVAMGRCEGVSTQGLKWQLNGATLTFENASLGVHNVVAGQPAWVAAESGDLLLFEGKWAEDHAVG